MKLFDWVVPPRRSFNSTAFPLINIGGRKSSSSRESLRQGKTNGSEEMKPLLASEKGMMIMDAEIFENWKLDGILTIGTLAVEALDQQQEEEEEEEEGEPCLEITCTDEDDLHDHLVEQELDSNSSTRPSRNDDVQMLQHSPSSDSSCGNVVTCNMSPVILECIADGISGGSTQKAEKLKGKMTMEKKGDGRRVTLLDLFKADSHDMQPQLQGGENDYENNGGKSTIKPGDGHNNLKNKTRTSSSRWCRKPLLILSEKPAAADAKKSPKKSMSSKAKMLFSRVKKLDQLMTRMTERKIHPDQLNDVGKLEKKGSHKNKYYEMITHTTSTAMHA